jgi:hypothetical protein
MEVTPNLPLGAAQIEVRDPSAFSEFPKAVPINHEGARPHLTPL